MSTPETDKHFPFPEPTEPYIPKYTPKPLETAPIVSVRHSSELGKLAAALAKARLEFDAVLKRRDNPAFRSRYADLATVIDATLDAMAKQELVVIQSPTTKGKDLTLNTMLLHSSGEWISSDLTMPATMRDKLDAQTIGSATTYARRYALSAMLGVAGEDDDANEASGVGSAKEAQAVAKNKLAGQGTPSLFYIHHAESDMYEIKGAEDLMTGQRDLLKKFWSKTAGAVLCNAEQLEGLKYEFEQRNVPFAPLKEK